jgi:hypothetical protein
MTSGASATNSAYLRMRSASPAGQRMSIRTLRHTTERPVAQKADRWQHRLLRQRRERPRRRAAEQRD